MSYFIFINFVCQNVLCGQYFICLYHKITVDIVFLSDIGIGVAVYEFAVYDITIRIRNERQIQSVQN